MSPLQARDEVTIHAPAASIWAAVTDITLLPVINPGVVKASGTMNELYGTRTCDVENRGRKGTITERLVEFIPEERTVWKVERDSMGMTKLLKDTRFILRLEKIADGVTRVTAETYYRPAHFVALMMNALMMKKMFTGAQRKILTNIKALVENRS
jgi:hypothetical protein